MTSISCPNCGLFNPDTAVLCDCGYQFTTKSITPESVQQAKDRKPNTPPPFHESREYLKITKFVFAFSVILLALLSLLQIAGPSENPWDSWVIYFYAFVACLTGAQLFIKRKRT